MSPSNITFEDEELNEGSSDIYERMFGFPQGKLGKALAGIGLIRSTWGLTKEARTWWREHKSLTISINSTDSLYTEVLLWLTESLDTKKLKGQTLTSLPKSKEASENQAYVRVYYDGTVSQKIVLDGHPITVRVHNNGANKSTANEVTGFSGSRYFAKPDQIVFTARSHEGISAVINKVSDLNKEFQRRKRAPRLFTMSRYEEFTASSAAPVRSLDSVILKRGQLDDIISDIQLFLDSEDRYTELGMPWHRGYLFHGPPGTGKTSLAKALAGYFGLDVYYMSLNDVKGDTNLMAYLNTLQSKSVLLLEDVDVFSATHDREASQGVASMSALLNALDGVSTPHGMITIMTTNHVDKLDSALLRPGRVDRSIALTPMDKEQGESLYRRFYGDDAPDLPISLANKMPAEVVELFKQHMYDANSVVDKLLKEYVNVR